MTKQSLDLKNSALLVIDVQRYFFDRGAPAFLSGAPKALPNVLRLVEAFREKGLPIVFTRHAHRRGRSTGQMGRFWNNKLPWEGTGNAKLVSELTPRRGELVITKTRYSAFEGTRLGTWLKRKRVRSVIICGVMTNLCVETTARHAFIKDLSPVIVEDACAANTVRHHRASILNLSYGFAEIEKTSSIVTRLSLRGNPRVSLRGVKRRSNPLDSKRLLRCAPSLSRGLRSQ